MKPLKTRKTSCSLAFALVISLSACDTPPGATPAERASGERQRGCPVVVVLGGATEPLTGRLVPDDGRCSLGATGTKEADVVLIKVLHERCEPTASRPWRDPATDRPDSDPAVASVLAHLLDEVGTPRCPVEVAGIDGTRGGIGLVHEDEVGTFGSVALDPDDSGASTTARVLEFWSAR